ncbi:MAG: competence/damage-inducible protein A [Bacteroidota bacterium]|nr:competence/damage-inducible protein A [Bacteroidota bacterium]
MFAEIITIGDEILIGQVIDTNSAWIASELNLIGFRVKQITSVSDDKIPILEAFENAQNRADLIIITGGLGPTRDDKTKPALCEFFNTRLIFNEEAFENIERIFTSRNRKITGENKKQAELPEACIPLKNTEGTAYGMLFEKNNKMFVSLPGVPYEMKYLIKNEVLPRVIKHFKTPFVKHLTILTQGVGESILAEAIEKFEDDLPEYVKLAYLPSPGSVRLRLSAVGENLEELNNTINKYKEQLIELIPEWVCGINGETIQELLGSLLSTNNKTVSTAESCTGGYISHLITSIPGSSSYYSGSIIAYSNAVKIKELGITKEVIEKDGAVSQKVVEKMALACKSKFNTDYSIAVSGIAGPSGGTPEKPVGTVWISIATPQKTISKKFLFGKNRERNILITAITAINMLRKEILTDQ